MSDNVPHKNDPGVYNVTYFNPMGRKETYVLIDGAVCELEATFATYTQATQAAEEWRRFMDGNSAVVHRCIYNTKAPRKWPEHTR